MGSYQATYRDLDAKHIQIKGACWDFHMKLLPHLKKKTQVFPYPGLFTEKNQLEEAVESEHPQQFPILH